MAEDSNSGVDFGSEHSIAFKVDGCGHPRVISVPPKFCSATIKLAALEIHLLGVKNLCVCCNKHLEGCHCAFDFSAILYRLWHTNLLSSKNMFANCYCWSLRNQLLWSCTISPFNMWIMFILIGRFLGFIFSNAYFLLPLSRIVLTVARILQIPPCIFWESSSSSSLACNSKVA